MASLSSTVRGLRQLNGGLPGRPVQIRVCVLYRLGYLMRLSVGQGLAEVNRIFFCPCRSPRRDEHS